MEAVSVNHVTKRYSNHVALDDLTFQVPERSIFGLLGPNGAGKTTLIRIINQIINSDAGEIKLFDELLQPRHVGVIGYLPEERGLYKKIKIGEQLIYLARLKGLSRKEATDKIKAWFVKFDIKDWWGKKVEDLSKGMAQKVQFISTVMHEPRLIILDEPFSGFDPVNAQLITDEILQLREKGCTILFSTHRMETVEALCDHIVLINKSKKILEGPKKTIKENYKSNTYVIDHKGLVDLSSDRYQVVDKKNLEDGMFRTMVKTLDGGSPNRLLKELIDKTEIHGFTEKIPTISEIFIQLVSHA